MRRMLRSMSLCMYGIRTNEKSPASLLCQDMIIAQKIPKFGMFIRGSDDPMKWIEVLIVFFWEREHIFMGGLLET